MQLSGEWKGGSEQPSDKNFLPPLSQNGVMGIWPTICRDDIVISGVSGRFPECDNLAEFKENLFKGRDMISDDDRRWTPGIHDLPSRSGKLKNLEKFDAQFFGVHAKQSHYLDPQVRKLLEVSWEAILDAGVNPSLLRGTKTGVYVGVYSSESEEGLEKDADQVNGYGLVGCERGMFANRLSFTFDLKGPSFSLDAGCASSLLALEQAVSAIRLGHCDAAIVGGVNLTLKAIRSLQYHRFGMLSPDGRCKAFDASANGYVRSEAVVAIFVQKKPASLRSHATILHAKTNTDGYKEEGITFPSGKSQISLLQEIYEEAGVRPGQVAYVECHGTGTKVGDPQEVNAIAEILCKDRSPDQPLLIGSVKSNMGHSEAAAGLCGIVKVLIAYESKMIPQNLYFSSPNPKIPALSSSNPGGLNVVTSNTKWDGGIVGVSSFGFGGTNVHVILKSESKTENDQPAAVTAKSQISIVPFSGRTQETVQFALNEILNLSKEQKFDTKLISLIQQVHRWDIPGHKYRGFALLTPDEPEKMGEVSKILEKRERTTSPPPIWLILSGMGCQWTAKANGGMTRDLMVFPSFKKSIEKCTKILKSNADLDLLQILCNDDSQIFEKNVTHSFISIVSVQIALLDLLTSLGVMATTTDGGIIGHSVGELTSAYAASCLTIEQTIMAAYQRGKTITDSNLPPGAMAAVGLEWDELKLKCPPQIFPACHNSTDSTTVSGPVDQVKKFVEELARQQIFAKLVNSSDVAFHSPYVSSVAPKFQEELEKLIPSPKQRGSQWLSTSVPEGQWSEPWVQMSSAEYHVNNLVSPVLFQQALNKIKDGSLVIEVAPHCLLNPILKRALLPSNSLVVGLMNKNVENNAKYFLNAIATIFQIGCQPNLTNLYGNHDDALCENSIGFISPLIKWDHRQNWQVTKFQDRPKSHTSIDIFDGCDLSVNPKTRTELVSPVTLVGKVADILGMQMADISNYKSTLTSLGLDSLQEIQIKNLLEREQNLNLTLKQVRLLNFEKIVKIQNENASESSSSLVPPKIDQNHIKITMPPKSIDFDQLKSPQKLDTSEKNKKMREPFKSKIRRLALHSLIYYPVGCLIFIIFTCGVLISLSLMQITKLILTIFYNGCRTGTNKKLILMNRPLDTIFALNPQTSNIIMTFKCDGQPDLGKIIKIFDQRVLNWETNIRFNDKKFKKTSSQKSYQPFDRLRWTICQNFFFYFWEKQENFHLPSHFSLQKIENGSQNLDKEIKKWAEHYLKHEWDGSRPQWNVQILAQNSSENSTIEVQQFALIFVYHHCYGDGASLAQLINYAFADEKPPVARQNLFDLDDDPMASSNFLEKWTKLKMGAGKLFHKIWLPFFLLQNGVQLYSDYRRSGPPLKNLGKNSKRHCAWSTVELKKLRSIKQNGKPVVMTTLVLSIVSKIYQKMFDGIGKKCPENLVVWLPYAPFTPKKVDLVNNFVCAPTSIPAGIQERRQRLKEIDENVRFGSSHQYLQASWLFTAAMSMMMRPFLMLNAIMPKFPIIFSNVPFDSVPPNFKAFDGHRVTHMFGWTPLCMGTHASLCAAITNEVVTFSLVADDSIVTECPNFVEDFFQFFHQELNSLANIHHDYRG